MSDFLVEKGTAKTMTLQWSAFAKLGLSRPTSLG
jgi:hypothetical protein